MRVLFWGTPEFAAPALRALVGEGFDVVGVVTQPDRAQKRSRSTLVPSPVKRIAVEEGIPVLQPERPRGDAFLGELRVLAPDISIVVAYGHILPQDVIDLPSLGTLNIHASLLPRWRGAAPIQAAIRSGATETGVTIMRMVQALDAGPIILQAPTPIAEDETYGELQLRLSELGALALVESLALISIGEASETAQDEALATYAPKVEREQARVDWGATSDDVARLIRAYDPRPAAFTTTGGSDVKLFGARALRTVLDVAIAGGASRPASSVTEAAAAETAAPPGTVVGITDEGMLVACGDGAVRITEVQPAGRRRVPAFEWERGRGIGVGRRLGD